MKKTITIEIPEGKTYKQTVDENGNLVIQYIDKEPVKSKSWKEFCENHPIVEDEYYISSQGKIKNIDGLRNSSCDHHLATKEDAEGILALIQLTRLHDEWVSDSNYKDFEQKAYIYILPCTGEPEIYIGKAHCLLGFPSYKMAQEFIKCFKDLIEKAKKFI